MIRLEALPPPAPPPSEAPAAPSVSTPSEPGGFQRVVEALGDRIDSGDALMRRALGGGMGELDAGALIAVQAGIYRYAEAVDLTAKLVDRSGTAIRTVLQGSH